MEYSFHIYNKMATDGITMAADSILSAVLDRKKHKTKGAGMRSNENSPDLAADKPIKIKMQKENFSSLAFGKNSALPVIVCVGSDLAIGDCLGPITGSMLKFKTQGLNAFLYGTLSSPVTAKEIKYMRTFLKETHKNSPIIAIDAAVGSEGDIGLIKINDSPLFPGAGANKKLGAIGDMSIMGIVAEKSVSNYGIFNTTRLNLVYSMSEIISQALSTLLWEYSSRQTEQNIAKNA